MMEGALEEHALSDESLGSGATPGPVWNKDHFDHMKKETGGEVEVLVRTLDKKEFKCRVHRDISVLDLKSAVARATGVQSHCQRLLSGGKEMSDECLLSDYSKAAKPMIYLVVRFPGATFAPILAGCDVDSELPSTVGEESALRSYAFRGTVTIPVPERSIERVMASLLQRGVVNGSHLQHLAALSANTWRSTMCDEDSVRTERAPRLDRDTAAHSHGHGHSHSHGHYRRYRRRDQRVTDREREREREAASRRRDQSFYRHGQSAFCLPRGMDDDSRLDDGLLMDQQLYEISRESSYLVPAGGIEPEPSRLRGDHQDTDLTSIPDFEGLVLDSIESAGRLALRLDEESEFFDGCDEDSSSQAGGPMLQPNDWDHSSHTPHLSSLLTSHHQQDEEGEDCPDLYSLNEGMRLTGKRKHACLSSGSDASQEHEHVCGLIRRHRPTAIEWGGGRDSMEGGGVPTGLMIKASPPQLTVRPAGGGFLWNSLALVLVLAGSGRA